MIHMQCTPRAGQQQTANDQHRDKYRLPAGVSEYRRGVEDGAVEVDIPRSIADRI